MVQRGADDDGDDDDDDDDDDEGFIYITYYIFFSQPLDTKLLHFIELLTLYIHFQSMSIY